MKTIINLMHLDLIALSGKKNSSFRAMVILLVICALIGLFMLPFFWGVYAFAAAGLIVPTIINQEIRTEYEKTFCVVPADRKSIVLARYLFATLFISGLGMILYILMQVSLMLNVNNRSLDEFSEILELLGVTISVWGFHNIFFSTAFMIGMMLMSKQLRNYFKNGTGSKKNSLIRNVLNGILIYVIISITVGVLTLVSSIPFVQTVFTLISGILGALSKPANGVLLCLTLLVAGYGMVVYRTVCAMLEYDEREL